MFPRSEMVLVTQRKGHSQCWVRNKRTKEEKECTEDVSQRAGEEREDCREKRRAEEGDEQESKPLVPKQLEQPKKKTESKNGSLP